MTTPIATPTGNETSAAAFTHARRTGQTKTQRAKILTELATAYAGEMLTRQQLGTRLAMPINVVCPRVRELLDMGMIEIGGHEYPQGKPARSRLKLTEAGWVAFEQYEGSE